MARSKAQSQANTVPQSDAKAESSVFNQPLAVAQATEGGNVIGLSPQRSNTFETREAWLEAANVDVVKWLSEQEPPVKVASDVMISINAPMAKRQKNTDGNILHKGKFAQMFPPDQSTNGRYQIFVSSHLDGDRDLIFALIGQLIRTSVWKATDTKDGLSKDAKAVISRFGLVYETETGKIACTPDSPLLAYVATLVSKLGPSPYARIEIKAKDLAPPTATRAARVFCANKDCACRKTEAAANAKKNPDGGFVLNPSDGWILEVLKKANVEVSDDTILANKPMDLNGVKCWLAENPATAPNLKFTWSEYKVIRLAAAKEGKKADMR